MLALAPQLAFATNGVCPTLPSTMKAAVVHAAAEPDGLGIETRALPRASAGEALVHVRYAGVNPVDWKLQLGGGLSYPAVPGADFSGKVVALGPEVEGFTCGDAVAGIVAQDQRQGSYAEYVAVAASEITAKPNTLTFQQAAAYPTVAVAAHRYLVATGHLRAGEKVLIHGGAVGIGSVAVQIAKAQGAKVYATTFTRNQSYLKELGVDMPIDYTL